MGVQTTSLFLQVKGIEAYRDLSLHLNGYGLVQLASLNPFFIIEVMLAEQQLQLSSPCTIVAQDHNLVHIGDYVCCSWDEKVIQNHYSAAM